MIFDQNITKQAVKELEKYDPKKHKNYHIAPSTKKLGLK